MEMFLIKCRYERSVWPCSSQRGRQKVSLTSGFMISWECEVWGGVLPNQIIEESVVEVFV